MNNYLIKIINETKKKVAMLHDEVKANEDHILNRSTFRKSKNLKAVLGNGKFHVIAEVKRRSPSKGSFARIEDPISLVKQYIKGNASVISVLTNENGFGGCLDDLTKVSTAFNSSSTLFLRKDFIIDPIQIKESIIAGADAVLLIVSITQEKTKALLNTCKLFNLDAVVEVHTCDELNYALEIGADIIGVNNRDLKTFNVDANNALQLKKYIPNHIISIVESGINSIELALQYKRAGFNAALIGEALVNHQAPSRFIQEIIS